MSAACCASARRATLLLRCGSVDLAYTECDTASSAIAKGTSSQAPVCSAAIICMKPSVHVDILASNRTTRLLHRVPTEGRIGSTGATCFRPRTVRFWCANRSALGSPPAPRELAGRSAPRHKDHELVPLLRTPSRRASHVPSRGRGGAVASRRLGTHENARTSPRGRQERRFFTQGQ